MTEPAPIDVAAQRRRLMVMAAINVVCLFVALAGAVGFISFHLVWMGGLFAIAILAGFAAQVWLVLGLKRRP